MNYLVGVLLALLSLSSFAEHANIYDESRDRNIPISIAYPDNVKACQSSRPCEVIFISAGYRVPYEKYTFLTGLLTKLNYLVVSIDHELPSDPPLSRTGDLYETRIENWQRGAKTLEVVQDKLSKRFINYNFKQLTLIGHSNGGDISTWLANENSSYVKQLITLDHKRVTLPKNKKLKVLSITSPEYPIKKGVLLTPSERKRYAVCIIEIANSKHMDLTDYGSVIVKEKVIQIINRFLSNKTCHSIKNT
ncbi:alpha/beta hydrolase [Psychromonas sp. Urea-02u-13]|uniref:alpha/beta hydrolase n=1 Tax=Psychromonas sp. Urea-02u-13 TaxID=2058326 RepID=UPI000C336696|nr:alpha/beta hydrolase [Psychromonas sp. Urea-02u-13]PKG37392.1 alpha/beta hydrolase [Psychromonas sp. Urea-02u-13]